MRFLPRLRPSEPELTEYFVDAAKNAREAAGVLGGLVEPGTDRERVREELVRIEHENDQLTHELYNRINASFITPFDREDMYRLGSRLDDVIDHLEAAATLVILTDLFGAEPPPDEVADQLSVLVRLADLTTEAFGELLGKRDLQPYWIGANSLENEGDEAYRRLLAHLFGGDYSALAVVKIKEVADELEDAADAFEQVANTVEAILAKGS